MSKKIAIRDAYGEALRELGAKNKNVIVLDADVSSSSKSSLFGAQYPDRFFNVGIAEVNMVAMAAGMSKSGKIPFVNTFAAFIVLRGADPVRSLIAYEKLNVKLAGAYAGLSDSYDGASHHSIIDIAFMRALPNMTVVSVADAVETKKAVQAIAEYNGPVYLRLSRAEVPTIFDGSYKFELGKGVQLTEGNDVTIIATGYMVQKSLEAAEQLKGKGINVRIINIHTIKPIDKELIIKCAKETGAVITVEEHSIYGGLGSAVAEVLIKEYIVPMEIIGAQDTFAETGAYELLLNKYGLCTENIINTVQKVMKRKL